MRQVGAISATAVLLALLGGAASAHEIPASAVVQVFAAPSDERLTVLVRAPLAVFRDVEFVEPDGWLDVGANDGALREGVLRWIVPSLDVFENGALLPDPALITARLSLPSDRAFTDFDTAQRHMDGAPLPASMRIAREQALVDIALEYPIASADARFAVRPAFARLGLDVVTVLRFVQPPEGGVRRVRAFEFRGDPGVVELDPRWHQALGRFAYSGFLHILSGSDHLLFLLCLVIPFRQLRPLVLTVTAFTVAHSVTLTAAALGAVPDALWFPPLVETLIAGSILYMAIENIIAREVTVQRRATVAFTFGLVHGFGFSFALAETLQFAGSHLVTALLAFNIGVEAGQVAVLLVVVPLLNLLSARVASPRLAAIVLSVLVAHVAWHWTADRWAALRLFPFGDIVTPLVAVRVLLVVTAAMTILWLVRVRRRDLSHRRGQ